MAIKDTLSELAQQAGLDAETAAAVLKALDNSKFSSAMETSFSRQSDYSRSMDALRQQQAEFERTKNEVSTWWTDAQQRDSARETALQAYRQRFGDLANPQPNGNQPPAFDPAKYINRDDLAKLLAEERNRTIGLNASITKDVVRAQAHYQRTFGKELDLDAFEQFALKANKPLKDAYRDYIDDDLKAKEKVDSDAATKAAEERGYQRAISQHNLPVDSSKSEPHVLFDRLAADRATGDQKPAPLGERARAAAFAEEWNKAGAAA